MCCSAFGAAFLREGSKASKYVDFLIQVSAYCFSVECLKTCFQVIGVKISVAGYHGNWRAILTPDPIQPVKDLYLPPPIP